ncbi:MAG TPA: hypothetical protein VMH86_10620 [Rhizomicrobium sp.]|nr:hypothetical protein [Rhizomicrobium sp.]
MHEHMFLVGGILHATFISILAFFILFAAGKAGGFTRTLGTLLGYWVLIIAILVLVCGVMAGMNGGKVMGMDMMGHHHGWKHCDMDKDGDATAPAASATPAPAPAAMTPATPKKPK